MPHVNFRLTPDGLTTEKKKTLIREVTNLLERELGKNPATTFVTIEEISANNWGVAGRSVAEIRKSADAAKTKK